MQTKTRSFRDWEKLDMNHIERRKVLCSVTFHLIGKVYIWIFFVEVLTLFSKFKNFYNFRFLLLNLSLKKYRVGIFKTIRISIFFKRNNPINKKKYYLFLTIFS